MSNATCVVDGCDRDKGRTKGMCSAHYTRLRRHGDVQANKPLQKLRGAPRPECSVESCGTLSQAKGLCGAHYSRLRKYGTVMEDVPVNVWGGAPEQCSVERCDRDAIAKGLCGGHWARVKYYGGDPIPDKPLKGESRVIDGKAWCARHEKLLPTDMFYTSSSRSNGFDGYCIACKKHLAKTEYREGIARAAARWREDNAELMAGYKRKYAETYPDRRSTSCLTYNFNRRVRLRENGGESTSEQIEQRWDYYGRRCWVCHDEADSTDHVKPVSKGGTGWPANLRPICRSCNSAKSNTWPYQLEVARGRSTSRGEVTPRAA